MNDNHAFDTQDTAAIREMLSGSGYSDKAIDYYLNKPNMGSLPDADQVSELTGPCGDTMKVFLKVKEGRIKDARVQVLGCPGAVASAMVVMDLIKGKTLGEAQTIKDRDIYRVLQEMPEKKLHCIRLSVKAMQKALEEYGSGNGDSPQGK
ncbi:MAG TPA: iron-sulfur cluster assembly scaffold protein [Desulfobacterales bacterium]|nr:iron-sulfur cluster assembly scaffold protein [Desulfobacterales bacterium]